MWLLRDVMLHGGDLVADLWVRHNSVNYSYQKWTEKGKNILYMLLNTYANMSSTLIWSWFLVGHKSAYGHILSSFDVQIMATQLCMCFTK